MKHNEVPIENANRLYDSVEREYLVITGWSGDDIVAGSNPDNTVLIENACSSDRYIPVKVDTLKE